MQPSVPRRHAHCPNPVCGYEVLFGRSIAKDLQILQVEILAVSMQVNRCLIRIPSVRGRNDHTTDCRDDVCVFTQGDSTPREEAASLSILLPLCQVSQTVLPIPTFCSSLYCFFELTS